MPVCYTVENPLHCQNTSYHRNSDSDYYTSVDDILYLRRTNMNSQKHRSSYPRLHGLQRNRFATWYNMSYVVAIKLSVESYNNIILIKYRDTILINCRTHAITYKVCVLDCEVVLEADNHFEPFCKKIRRRSFSFKLLKRTTKKILLPGHISVLHERVSVWFPEQDVPP